MKGPNDIARRERGLTGFAAAEAGPVVPSGKTYLRQAEFLEERGLSRQSKALSLDGAPVRGIAEAPTAPYLRGARERKALLEEAPPSTAVVWQPLGPAGIPDGQTYGSGPGSTATMAGRVPAIAVDPSEPDHVLVGTAAGGVWETRDGGANWAPRTDDQPTLSIGALAFDPSEPSTVYAGTGEGNSEYFHLGQGILVSRDGGTTWSVIAADVFAGIGFYRLVVDPRDGQRLIAATTGGAAISADGGKKWSLLHKGLSWDVSLAYLGDEAEILLGAPDGLFSSRGGGALSSVEVPGLQALDPDSERIAVAHVLSDPGQAFAFAATQGEARLWHRSGADGTYDPVELPSFAVGEYVENVLDVGQGSYDWHLSVPPAGDDTIYLGAIELVKGVRTGGEWEWSDISSRIGHGDSIHPDQHTMTFDAQDPNAIFAGNDGGIFRSPDAGQSWQSLNAGLAISEVGYLTQRPDEPLWLLAGLQDNGTIRRESPTAWTQVGLGDGGDCGTNMANADVCFHSYYYMDMERSSSRGDPDSWQNATPPGDTDKLLKLFYPPVEVNGDVVAKAGEIVYASRDGGRRWSRIPLPQPHPRRASIASALAIPTAESIFVGTIQGEVLRIDVDSGRWGAPTTLKKPRDGWISDLLVDPATPNRHWATFSNPGAVFRSDDAGASWTDVTANLPSLPVNAIVTDPFDRDRVWVASDLGVFESTDAGANWSVFGTGLPNALAVDLLFYEPDRLLRVATRSRGVWEAAVG
jgi:photosystem II stability/assembly factor-like uncharacterized protein